MWTSVSVFCLLPVFWLQSLVFTFHCVDIYVCLVEGCCCVRPACRRMSTWRGCEHLTRLVFSWTISPAADHLPHSDRPACFGGSFLVVCCCVVFTVDPWLLFFALTVASYSLVSVNKHEACGAFGLPLISSCFYVWHECNYSLHSDVSVANVLSVMEYGDENTA